MVLALLLFLPLHFPTFVYSFRMIFIESRPAIPLLSPIMCENDGIAVRDSNNTHYSNELSYVESGHKSTDLDYGQFARD